MRFTRTSLMPGGARNGTGGWSARAILKNSRTTGAETPFAGKLGDHVAVIRMNAGAAGQGTVALNRKAIDIALRNINTSFGLAERLAGAKNVAEAMELQTTYWRNQVGELAAQAGEMRTLSTKVTADVAAPIKAQVTRRMRGLHKAT